MISNTKLFQIVFGVLLLLLVLCKLSKLISSSSNKKEKYSNSRGSESSGTGSGWPIKTKFPPSKPRKNNLEVYNGECTQCSG